MERRAFLARVAERLGGTADEHRGARGVALGSTGFDLPAELPRTPSSGDGRGFDRFAEELAKVGGAASRVRSAALTDAIAGVAAGRSRAVVATDVGMHRAAVEEGLRRAGCAVDEPTREAAAVADIGVTGAVLGVASTGSVLVTMGPDGPRVASLLPAMHVVVLEEEHLVPGFEELFDAWAAFADASQVVLITGPSRTADIELSIVRGVHGPEDLHVVVIS